MNISVVALALSIFFMAVSQLLFKHGMTSGSGGKSGIAALFRWPVVTGISLNVIAAICWLLAIARLELSYAFPFLSLNYLIVPLLARLIFGESLGRKRVLGILIVTIGVIVVAQS